MTIHSKDRSWVPGDPISPFDAFAVVLIASVVLLGMVGLALVKFGILE